MNPLDVVPCGCCVGPADDRCCCHFHQDMRRGIVPKKCSRHGGEPVRVMDPIGAVNYTIGYLRGALDDRKVPAYLIEPLIVELERTAKGARP